MDQKENVDHEETKVFLVLLDHQDLMEALEPLENLEQPETKVPKVHVDLL